MDVRIEVNGAQQTVSAEEDTPLLYILRNDLGLKGTKFGCGEGTCGSCMVLIDGEPVNSCDIPISQVEDRAVTTVEGFADRPVLASLQDAFVAEQAAQCGYCMSGILMSACALLEGSPEPSKEEIRTALDGNLCRCGSHPRVLRAVERVARGDLAKPADPQPEPVPLDERSVPDGVGIGSDYLRVMPDGTVRMTSGKVDIGQGITTALAQIAADELGVAVSRIRIVGADTTFSPDEGTTAGSLSVEQGGAALRESAAGLRARLLSLAAEDLGTVSAGLEVHDGRISSPEGASVTYWELAGGAGSGEETKDGDLHTGRPIQRWDLPRKFRGEPTFIQDLELPGMLHGRVVRPPDPNARLVSIEDQRTRSLPGVVEVVRSGSFLGIVAEREEQAIRAVRALRSDTRWEEAPGTEVDPTDPSYLLELPARRQDAVDAEPPPEERAITATYTRRFLAHASIGPSCALAQAEEGTMTVWTHSQSVYGLRGSLSRVLAMDEEDIRVIHVEGAGCYGHNGADDVALDAALIARAVPGRPVRVQWSREDEFSWEPYGSAMVINLSAALDDDGRISHWSHEAWSHPHSSRPGTSGSIGLLAADHLEDPPDPVTLEPIPLPNGGMLRNAIPIYDIPNLAVHGNFIPDGPVRTSALRGLGAPPNTFAIESFMDELAERAGVDPVEFRLRHLADPRARAVIETVVEQAGVRVGGQGETGHGYGIGFGRYKNRSCYVAVIAEVRAEQEVEVIRTWAAVDAGLIVNPDGVRNQIEGGIVQAVSMALFEQIGFEEGTTATRSWLDYPILKFGAVPEIEMHLIDRPGEPSVGVGEGAAGPTTAAIANGLRAALGVAVRDLPFTPDRVMKAILD